MWKQQQEVKHNPHAKPTLQHNLFGIGHKHVQGSLFLVNLAFDRVLLERTFIDKQQIKIKQTRTRCSLQLKQLCST